MLFLQRKILLATSGVVVIVIATAVFVMFTSATASRTVSIAASVTATPLPVADVTATPTPDGSTPIPGTTPTLATTKVMGTATPTPRASATPTTPPVAGQQIDWFDSVRSVGTNSFTLHTHTATVLVNEQTVYSGTAHALSQMRGGMRVEVHGVVQTNGDVLATEVNTHSGDN